VNRPRLGLDLGQSTHDRPPTERVRFDAIFVKDFFNATVALNSVACIVSGVVYCIGPGFEGKFNKLIRTIAMTEHQIAVQLFKGTF
jgi:hypothetical protein